MLHYHDPFSMPFENQRNQIFARNFKRIMDEQGRTASDVAKMIWGTTKDKDGYNVAKHRDLISNWVNGRTFPKLNNLRMLAKALGVSIEDLSPNSDHSDPRHIVRGGLRWLWQYKENLSDREHDAVAPDLVNEFDALSELYGPYVGGERLERICARFLQLDETEKAEFFSWLEQ